MNLLSNFYTAIKEDNRIGTTHIALYMSLFYFYELNRFCNPIPITRAQVMESAKINGLATYHKCIKELHEYGYIEYIPSYNPAINSQVQLLKL